MKQSINFKQQHALVSGPQESREYEMPRHYNRSIPKKNAISYCFITFKLVKDSENEVKYILKIDKVNDVPLIEQAVESTIEQLPATGLLEHWMLEVRKRHNGRRDKVYSHPRSGRAFRTLVQVSNFIGDNYYPDRTKRLEVYPRIKTIPLHKMHIISANNSVKKETPAASLNEAVQPNVEQVVTADETKEAKDLTNELCEDIDLNVEVKLEDYYKDYLL